MVENNQILNYWFQDDDLSNFNFYDFIQCLQLQKINKFNSQRSGSYCHFTLKHPHQLGQSHELTLHTNPDLYDLAPNLQIPRVVGCSIPHASNELKYVEFMVAHFKPFSPTNALLKPTETFEDVFQSYCFNKFSKQVM